MKKILPADKLHCLNFFTMSIKMEYFKLVSEVIPANSNVTKPINLTSGCFYFLCCFKEIEWTISSTFAILLKMLFKPYD